MTETHDTPVRLRTSLRTPLLAGAAVMAVFFGGFGSWAALAPLSGAVMAPAVVVPEGSRKTVQHLEGGIAQRVLVKDGDAVAAGQPLIALDDTRVRADHAALLAEWQALAAAAARLEAERSGAATPSFPPELTEAARRAPEVARLLGGEQDRLAERRQALEERRAMLLEQAGQARAEITGHEAGIASATGQLALITEEIATVETLLKKGLERKPRLLALERAKVQIEGQSASAQAAIARAKQTIAETEAEMRAIDSEAAERAANELAETRRSLAKAAEQLRAAADRLERSVVRAPVAGTVVDLQVTTEGGVLAPGAKLMDIVPADATMLLEARVAPVDIDEVQAGLGAQVHLLAYKSRNLPRIEGVVRAVSPDRLEDPHTRQPYYLARVAVAPEALPEGLALSPGMPAEIAIATKERTLLHYLTQPLTDSLRRGLRES